MTRAIERYLTSPLSVLALWQPVATLCVAPDPAHDGKPAKEHETRHWYPYEKLPIAVAIHAAKKFDADNRDSFTVSPFREALKRAGFYPGDPRPFLTRKLDPPAGLKPVPLGAIVGVATVVEILSATTPSQDAIDRGVVPLNVNHLSQDDRAFGYFVPNAGDPHPFRYAWRLADAIMLPEPIPHSGRQDPLYPPDLHLREQINAQLRGMVAP
jgi:hypothetical protein